MYGGQPSAILESTASYARHAVGNYQIFYLIFPKIKMLGIRERIGTKRYFTPCGNIRNMHGGQLAATIESIPFYARHAIWNRDGGQAPALIESLLSYARHAVLRPIVGDGVRDDYIA